MSFYEWRLNWMFAYPKPHLHQAHNDNHVDLRQLPKEMRQ